MMRAMIFPHKFSSAFSVGTFTHRLPAQRFASRSLGQRLGQIRPSQISLSQISRWLLGMALVQVAIALLPQSVKPSYAAERISFSFGAIERSIARSCG
jgi:hypothetical protein